MVPPLGVDGRDEPGHDGLNTYAEPRSHCAQAKTCAGHRSLRKATFCLD
jgi:hypothetical protein